MANLAGRRSADLDKELNLLAGSGRIALRDAERLWLALAAAYGIAPERLRAADRINDELVGVVKHPDYDPFTSSLFVLHKAQAAALLDRCEDWADLIVAVRAFERACGELVTEVVMQDGTPNYRWKD